MLSEPVGGGVRHAVSFLRCPALFSVSQLTCIPTFSTPPGGRKVLILRYEPRITSPATRRDAMSFSQLQSREKVLRLAEVCSGLPLCPHIPSERSGWVPLAATCLSECSFAQLAGHHLGITPVPVLSHVRLNFKNPL